MNPFVTFDKLIASKDVTLKDLNQQITKATYDLELRNKKKQEIKSHINYIEKIAKEKFDSLINSGMEKLSGVITRMIRSVSDVGDYAKPTLLKLAILQRKI